MKKYFYGICIVLIVITGGCNLYLHADFSKSAMSFPEELDQKGCLGLTYHRVRKHNFFNKTVEFLTGTDELTVYNVYEDVFKKQIKILKKQKAVFLNPDEIRKAQETGKFPEKCVWVSFDDIDISMYENAFPILKENDIPFTLFVIAGHVGRDFDNLQLTSWDQLQEMVNSGLATVGSHTFDMHKLVGEKPIFFVESNLHAFENDLLLSKKTIEKNLGVQVEDFAYPYGNGKDELAAVIQRSGFKSASILAPRSITLNNDAYWMNRILVNDEVFKKIVTKWID
ncbi:polysaccharide deacetylase family protein [Paenibacillus sp. BSR1-1]|uniref:polysaccharide deacetylase family protein n=1 Tax=Paenibacillus sp. BSR1-1 TaxID=3020845 RepID=UPI0025B232F7|nr:polysaccharide deacetylase family protein [Paenibacillus sp. BSR1-1]MDN3018816.1 polysaccharide deacetylase family protein [Paenibacillus sp. BSR1-1]